MFCLQDPIILGTIFLDGPLPNNLYISEVLSHDALRMRLRRMVEVKQSGKCHVPQEVVDDFKTGGELKEWLEIALLESIKKVGTDRTKFKAVKVGVWEFLVRFNHDKHVYFNCFSKSIEIDLYRPAPYQAEFKVRCKVVKERMLHKEKEVKGKWVTREKMDKSGEYSK